MLVSLLSLAWAAPPDDATIREAVRAVYDAPDLDDHDICIERSEALPEVVAVGTFAHDKGCDGAFWFVGDARIEDRGKATQAVMKGAEDPKATFQAWLVKGLLAFDSAETGEKPKEFRQKGFHTPEVTQTGDVLTARAWTRDPVGMIQSPPSWTHHTVTWDLKKQALGGPK